jgi:hypothetical protein
MQFPENGILKAKIRYAVCGLLLSIESKPLAKYSRRFYIAHVPTGPRENFNMFNNVSAGRVCCLSKARGYNTIHA